MVLFIDMEKQAVLLYGEKGLTTLPFSKIGSLNQYVANKKVYYVTEAVETDANEILNLVCSITGQDPNELPAAPIISAAADDDGEVYIHYTGTGSMIIADIGITLQGKFDIRTLYEMQPLIAKSAMLQKLMKQGKVAIVNSKQRKQLMKEKRVWDAEQDKKQSARDEALDDIIVDRRTMEKGGTIMKGAAAHDAPEVDLEDENEDAGLMPHERGAAAL